MSEWIRTTHESPCPVCDLPDWCGIKSNGEVVRCMRVQSDRECVGSDGAVGWIHRVNGKPFDKPPPKESKPKRTPEEWHALAMRCFTADRVVSFRQELAHTLGVTAQSLKSIGTGLMNLSGKECATFPIRDWKANVIGIVIRFPDGSKRCVRGSHNSGLFYSRDFRDNSGCLFIPEGPSDVAAFLSAGLSAIGRPNNCGGADELRNILKPIIGKRRVLVVGENDEKPDKRGIIDGCPKDCEGCGYCWPGKWGAKWTAHWLGVPYVMPPEGIKDFRAYWKSGGVWTGLMEML